MANVITAPMATRSGSLCFRDFGVILADIVQQRCYMSVSCLMLCIFAVKVISIRVLCKPLTKYD